MAQDSSFDSDRDKRRFRFDPTINMGHVLTSLVFIMAAAGAWTAMDRRVTVIEVKIQNTELDTANRRQESITAMKEFRDDIRELTRTVDGLASVINQRKPQ